MGGGYALDFSNRTFSEFVDESTGRENYVGSITTLTIKTKATIKPVEKTAEKAPDYRVYAAGVEIGAAWSMTSKAEKPYLGQARRSELRRSDPLPPDRHR